MENVKILIGSSVTSSQLWTNFLGLNYTRVVCTVYSVWSLENMLKLTLIKHQHRIATQTLCRASHSFNVRRQERISFTKICRARELLLLIKQQ